ncbi:hypothetical protein [Demequina sp. NBRC 110051]|uniref:hypothetical protein n=1 Tax=Demequina sp. NBRC 110051 TaxID=1570340 RepID=UPI000A052272|nr:hypothetical protein [Demequina sp. NBRC 110051]
MSVREFKSQDLNQRPGVVTAAVDADGEAVITRRGVPVYRVVRIEHATPSTSLWDAVRALPSGDNADFPGLDGTLDELDR